MNFSRFAFSLFVLTLSTASLSAQSRAEKVQQKLERSPNAKWWEIMDTGPFISDTFKIFGEDGETGVLKGIAIKVGEDESHTIVFDTETCRMVAGFEGTVSLAGTPWDGKHGGNSFMPGNRSAYYFTTKPPAEVTEKDPRELDNGKPNGPLPDEIAEYFGVYRVEGSSVLHYSLNGVEIFEQPRLIEGDLVRSFHIAEREKPISVKISYPVPSLGEGEALREVRTTVLGLSDDPLAISLDSGLVEVQDTGSRVLNLPGDSSAQDVHVVYSFDDTHPEEIPPVDIAALRQGGPALYPETIEVAGRLGSDDIPYAVDSIPLPSDNPWESEIRFGAFDFFPDGKRAACSTWNGDVWIASGIDGKLDKVTWRRFASGLYQTLGLKIVDGTVYTMGRDQITKLHDLNEDGEADYYECFNNDVNITEGFHEFAFDLQTDAEGNFYFSKGMPVLGGGRGFAPWTEHNGTILKVSSDGEKLERMAWGLRAPGGLGLGPNGELTTGENEGSYVPRCKITWSKPDGSSFHGVVPSEWEDKQFIRTLDGAPTDYERPLCWLPYYVDNSSGSQFWVPENSSWKTHAGHMLHLSYGKSSVYRVLIDEVDGQVQGGVYRLPIELTTAVMRGRFHPVTGELYLIGFRGWQTNGGTGFQRVRYTGNENPVPTALEVHENGIVVKFSEALDPEVASDPRRYSISKWDYVWGPMYGSGRFSIDDRDDDARAAALLDHSKGSQNQTDSVSVRAASLLDGGRTVFLYIPEMTPAMQMEIKMDLASAKGTEFRETLWNTIHNLRPDFTEHGLDLTNLPEIDTAPVGEPGIILSMAHGSTDDALVLDRLALTLDEGGAFTPFIDPNRGGEVVFEGNLTVDTRDDLAFRLEGTGWASFRIDGKTIIEGDLPLESDSISLDAGPHSLFCNYRREITGGGKKTVPHPGQIQLLWSGSDFVWEPVRPSAFRHLPNAVIEAKNKIREGRDLFASVGCIRCHETDKGLVDPDFAMPELLESLPDFENIGHRLHQGWIEEWVRQPQDYCPSVAPDEAHHIAAYLATLKETPLSADAGNVDAGAKIAETLHFQPWAEELAAEAKHTPVGLVHFLKDPTVHHAATTFPHFRLGEQEATNLAAWIQSKQPKATEPTKGDPAKGKSMVEKRCLVCHGEPATGATYEFTAKPLKEMWEEEWLVRGCLSEEEGNAPELGLTLEQKQALLAFKNVDSNGGQKSLNRFVPHEYAARTQERLGCMNCHSGENTLPDITLAGEKLRDEWLAGLFHGEVLSIRPYQSARMPGFPNFADNLARGMAHGAGVTTGVQLTAPDKPQADAGAKVAGLTGYACTTCHAAGATAALQAFEGQGPNLQLSGERLREEYYMAWMHWPQRFIPTTIMPKYTADKETALNPTFFDGNAGEQFEALWQWMKTLEGAENAPIAEEH